VKEICGTAELPPVELELALEDGVVDAGAELELELLLLQAATSRAAETAAAAVRPALFADTEYNGVPRLLSRHASRACARPDPYDPISLFDRALLAEIVRPSRETLPLTRS
jgi:hypothetical protein